MTPVRTRVTTLWSRFSSAGRAGIVAGSGRNILGTLPPGGPKVWTRTNHRGELISLLSGPALTLGLLAGTNVSGAISAKSSHRQNWGHAIAISGGGIFGLIDDLGEQPSDRAKGLKGHLRELRHGRLTTGALKVFGIGASAAIAALTLTDRSGSKTEYLFDAALNTVLIAGTANFFNLLDLRPGRALKAGAAGALALSTTSPRTAGAVLGASVALIRADLAEQDMLGDCGANALGAAIGSGLICASRPTRVSLAMGVVALTVASERISFSQVIADTPLLHRLDQLGRRP